MRKKKPSGRFVLRIDPAIHTALRKLAADRGTSLNDLCVAIISRGLEAQSHSDHPVVAEAIRRFADDLVGVLVFGSSARGDTHDNSDIDFLIVLTPNVPLRRSLYTDWQLPDERISLHFSHLPETPHEAGSLWLECALDGQTVHDPSSRINRKLRELREFISAGKAVRKTTHGQGYWVFT